ncbi:hybrid sensor histidine kinase/response regulator [Roseovarius sp. 2305UL8-3]|uniref:hybrid sensor histidine kinase/response regulator n=1 Tax=Roseovarius conchicola TaxID=3121636 RepID=UPI0035281537
MPEAVNANAVSRSQRIGLASVVLLVLTVSLGLFLGVQTRAQFREIEASWADYSESVGRRGIWISSIRGYLGYGGIIHNFKNYVLRREEVYLERTRDQIDQFRATTDEYLAADIAPDERRVLIAVRRTIEEYALMLPVAIRAAEEGWDIERTDAAVRISDDLAIQALADLEGIWTVNRQISTDRMLAAVGRGQALIWIGFMSIAALVMSSLLIGFMLILLLRDMRGALFQLSNELRKRRELEQSNEQLARAVEQSPATIFMTNTDARIIYANRQFEKVTGWSRDEVIGRTPRFLQSGDTPEEEYQAIRARLDQGQDWQGVFRNRCKDGSSYWAETKILPLIATDGSIQNYIGIGEDVTEKRQAREHVARAQKLEAVGLLAGGIAHDFNNILTTIVGAAHLAAMDAPEDSDIATEIDQIDIAARRGQSLIRGLLTFARREPGRPQPNDLGVIIAEVSRLLRAAMPPTITLNYKPLPQDLMVLGDETHLHQIVMNLCRNAIEAIGGGRGVITVSAHRLTGGLPETLSPRPGGWVLFEVMDNGPGMSAETQRHLFDPFFTTKPLGKGSGLGLAVVAGLVEEMGGTIDVNSAPGQGARFTICLPGADSTVPLPQPEDSALPRGRERIVLVDDEAEIATTFRRVLLRLGYRVEAFTSSLVALEHIRNHPDRPDLLISDMVMPEMSGEELVNAVRRLRPDMPVIVCTGYNPSGLKIDGLPAKVMHKPVDPAKLARTIRTMFDQKVPADHP